MCVCEFIYGITILFLPGEAGVQRLVYIYIQDKLGIVTRKSILHTCGALIIREKCSRDGLKVYISAIAMNPFTTFVTAYHSD